MFKNSTSPLILALLCFFGLAALNCDRFDCWGNTMESKDKPYKGDPTAVAPYYKMQPTLGMMSLGCDNASCDYSVGAKVELHNPTNKPLIADVFCVFYLNENYEADKNSRKNVKMAPKVAGKSGFKLVTVSGVVGAPPGQSAQISVKCEAQFRDK